MTGFTADELRELGASHETMRVVYVAHPLGSGEDREANRQNASRWCGVIGRAFKVATVADWIVLSGQWDEATGRELGLRCDLALIGRCQELWLVGGRVSHGMAIELARARELGLSIRDLTGLGYEAPTGEFELPGVMEARSYFRAGDHVKHAPSGETWVLACDERDGRVHPAGWPESIAEAVDCSLVEAATDEERLKWLRLAAKPGSGSYQRRAANGCAAWRVPARCD